ncbi:gamma carbonic anhydrase family protein [Methylovirgula sp. 4M-Z18]|uniref:gamma carbonic anhydrase family protein n=1 Tax=Methylovirgula sp. 4M-Z18 TaxID=2293567 RepID=UPI000E2F6734|nr:gamma carbonic anhydrase family protein [Methylovirgula sp. 4M-Z18]RFB80540.1 gamma carbonic anhydrase family protein [Methylovirgula sp. 4M-Z18]
MILTYGNQIPRISPDAWVAADASVSGDVTIGPGARIMHGARIIAESGGSITIGRNCIVLENAVIRATSSHPCRIGDHCLIGPNSHVVGADIADEVFVATGASIFHGASVGEGAEIRINGIVHLRSRLAAGATVPIGWVAVGDPAEILSPDRHDEIWAKQKPLDFPQFVYGIDRNTPHIMREITGRLSAKLSQHGDETGKK